MQLKSCIAIKGQVLDNDQKKVQLASEDFSQYCTRDSVV